VAQSGQSLHFLWSWPQTAEGNHETGMSALVRPISTQDAKKRGTDSIFFVVLLDGTCLLQSLALVSK
jgi:hypothetical protein